MTSISSNIQKASAIPAVADAFWMRILRLTAWKCSTKMFYRLFLSPVLYRLLLPLHKLPAFCNHLSATVFSEEADVCL